MKILYRLKLLSSVYNLNEDEKSFYNKELPNFMDTFKKLLFKNPDEAKDYYSEISKKQKDFFKLIEKQNKLGNDIPELGGDKAFEKVGKQFVSDFNTATSLLAMYYTVEVGKTVSKTISDLQSAYLDPLVKDAFKFNWLHARDILNDELKKGTGRIVIEGPLNFFIEFKNNKLVKKYF